MALPNFSLPANLAALVGDDPAAKWEAPRSQDAETRAHAATAAAHLEQSLAVESDADGVAKWLGQLGILTAGKMTADDARMRLAAYAALLEHPAGCFTKGSLKRAAVKFTWFPSFAEVSEFLDGEVWWIKAKIIRLRKIAEHMPNKAEVRQVTSADLRTAIAPAVAALTSAKPRLDTISPAEFQRRREEFIRQAEELAE